MTLRDRAIKLVCSVISSKDLSPPLIDKVEGLLKTVIEEEREACAKICEEYAESYREITTRPGGSAAHYAVTAGNKCANKIRNRKGIDR